MIKRTARRLERVEFSEANQKLRKLAAAEQLRRRRVERWLMVDSPSLGVTLPVKKRGLAMSTTSGNETGTRCGIFAATVQSMLNMLQWF